MSSWLFITCPPTAPILNFSPTPQVSITLLLTSTLLGRRRLCQKPLTVLFTTLNFFRTFTHLVIFSKAKVSCPIPTLFTWVHDLISPFFIYNFSPSIIPPRTCTVLVHRVLDQHIYIPIFTILYYSQYRPSLKLLLSFLVSFNF